MFIMSPPVRVGRHIVFPRASVCPSVCLSVTNRVHSITWKPLKLYSRNFIQILISMRWRAECNNGNSSLYTFWVISLWTLFITIKRVHSITWKPLKLYSRNFIQVSTNMSRRAECKNSNSVIYTLRVIYLGTLSITKTIIYDYFMPCMIVQLYTTLTDIFTRYELIVCMKWLEFL